MRRLRRILVAIGVALGVAAVSAVIVALVFTSRPDFYAKYAPLARRVTTLEASAHRGIACATCHVDARGVVVEKSAQVGDFYLGLFTAPREPSFVAFAAPSSQACLACHRHAWSDEASTTARLPHPAHLRVDSETRDCVTCHKWTAHEEAYQAKHTTMPFSGVCASFECHVGVKSADDCADCHHVLHEDGGDWLHTHPTTVRRAGTAGCLEFCHEADQCQTCHATGMPSDLPASVPTAVVSDVEHAHVRTDWISQHGTTALDDPAACATCHISQGECDDCHSQRPAFHDPASTWLTRHKDVSQDERRCLTCHEKPWCDACHAQFKETR